MSTDFTFPLALCKAQFNIWLHALELCETIASRTLQNGIVSMPAATVAQARVVEPPPSRREAVNEALRTLHTALASAPARRLHPGRRAASVKGRA